MIDHITIRVSNLKIINTFYAKTLKPLGYELLHDSEGFSGFGKNNILDTWFTEDEHNRSSVHVARKAESKEEVDSFHRIALEAGVKDNGMPGARSEYGESYYASFVIDPEGNNIEAVYDGMESQDLVLENPVI